MLKNKLLLLIANFLHGAADAGEFSYAFPEALAQAEEALEKEDARFARIMDEMPEICAAYDPYGSGDPDTLDEAAFRERVRDIYVRAIIPPQKKVS